MICKFCATGADMQSRAKDIDELANTDVYAKSYNTDSLSMYGVNMHKFCRGSTHCDCQHKDQLSGKYIQKD